MLNGIKGSVVRLENGTHHRLKPGMTGRNVVVHKLIPMVQ